MAVSRSRKLTYEDYAAFPDDGVRRELIHGEVYATPAPNTRHQRIVLRLGSLFEVYLEEHGGGQVFVAPYDVLLAEHDVVQPDVVFVSDADASVITEANIQGHPTLVVEVVSDPRRDRVIKRDLYASLGVAEYWVVDPDADRIEVDRLEGGTYPKPRIVEPGETLSPLTLPGLVIDVARLLRR